MKRLMSIGYHLCQVVDLDLLCLKLQEKLILKTSQAKYQLALPLQDFSWDAPILVGWRISYEYLPQSTAEEFQKGNPSSVKLKLIEGAGHMPQEDWPEIVVGAQVFF